jgi:phytoene dehydrogenase-like protein
MSGGNLRLDSPVLRLAYDDSNRAVGVDLLSGEKVMVRKAIVSNMTVWDTYGKLVGLNRTPPEIRKQLNALRGAGVYVVYAVMEQAAISRLPCERMLVQDSEGEFTMAIASSSSVPGQRVVTYTCPTEIESWFAYQSSPEDYEEWDQEALEHFWTRLHKAMPELASDIEIIETANPRTYYEQTRRKLGMVLGVDPPLSYRTILPNVFIAGDTVSAHPTLNSVIETAMKVAKEIQ